MTLLLVGFAVRYRRRTAADRDPADHRLPAAGVGLDARPGRCRSPPCSSGGWSSTPRTSARRRTPTRCSSSASSGCGRSSTPAGQREINELHLPVGRPVKVTLHLRGRDPRLRRARRSASKIDVLPGRYVTHLVPARPKPASTTSSATSTAARGTRGWSARSRGRAGESGRATQALGCRDAAPWTARRRWRGGKLFLKLQCISCHRADADGPRPGAGRAVRHARAAPGRRAGGRRRRRTSASRSATRGAKVVEGWEPIMPAFRGPGDARKRSCSLIAYIQSLEAGATPPRPERARSRPPVGAPTEPPTSEGGRSNEHRPTRLHARRPVRAAPPPAEPEPAAPNYLNTPHSVASWLFTDRPQADRHPVPGHRSRCSSSSAGPRPRLVRLNLLSPSGAILVDGRPVQQAVHRPRHRDGLFFFLIPVIPAVLGNFFVPMMIGAKDLAFPKLNLRAGTSSWSGRLFACGGPGRRHRHRLDVLPAVQLASRRTPTSCPAAIGIVHLRVQLDHDRAEHHGHGPQDAVPRA